MSFPISPISPIPIAEPSVPAAGRATPSDSGEFGSVLDKAISEVEGSRKVATEKAERLLSGQPEELHSVVLTTQRAQLEFELFLEVRNKVVQAYQEIMRMQV
jgi:flagellar hook-basal body complex protein FliE